METPESISSHCEAPEMKARGRSVDSSFRPRVDTRGATRLHACMSANTWKHFIDFVPSFSPFNSQDSLDLSGFTAALCACAHARPPAPRSCTPLPTVPRLSTLGGIRIGHACERALRLKYYSQAEYLYSNTGGTLCTLYLTSCRILIIINCLISFLTLVLIN